MSTASMKRLLALFLALVMCFSMLPVSAFAEGDGEDDGFVIEEPEDYTPEPEPDPETVKEESAHEHEYVPVVTEPACTESGCTTWTCSCGDFYVNDETEPLGHDWTEVAAVDPTCTEPGRQAGVVCSVCGAVQDGCAEIPATGHTPVAVKAVPATEEEPGHEAGVVCSVCGAILEGCEETEFAKNENRLASVNGSRSTRSVGVSQAYALQWVQARVDEAWAVDYDGVFGCQCVDLIKAYYDYLGVGAVTGNGRDYVDNYLPDGMNRYTYYAGTSLEPGDVAVWTGSGNGHVAIVTYSDQNGFQCAEINYAGQSFCTSNWRNYSDDPPVCYIRPVFGAPIPPVLDDGDYIIAALSDRHYFLDIEGGGMAENGTNVQLYYTNTGNVASHDAWTVTYNGNGYYRIKQCGGSVPIQRKIP